MVTSLSQRKQALRDSEGERRNGAAAVMKQQEQGSAHVCEGYDKTEKMN